MSELHDLLHLCDEQRYLGSPPDAQERLHAAVARDPEQARELIASLGGCPRTVARHREYLVRALKPGEIAKQPHNNRSAWVDLASYP
jgi:hypothetical protein